MKAARWLGFAIFAAAFGSCGVKQAKFSIPLCNDDLTGCHCMLDGFTICSDVCVNLKYDHDNCGSCGFSCGDQVCVNGICVSSCGGLLRCQDRCKYESSPLDCSYCGNRCDGECRDGSCRSVSSSLGCPTGETKCGSGCCAGNCSNGICYSACAAGTTFCDGSCVNTESDPWNCGGCGKRCPSSLDVCYKSGGSYYCCDGIICDGQCVDPKTDWENCGRCGVICRNECSFGTCR